MKCEKEIAIQTSAHVKGKGFARVEAGETEKTLQETKAEWQRLAQPWEFRAPWPDMHAYLNGWALYQVLACRLLGRSSLYQSGGAYGFRDQLQDVCALLETALAFAREQILRACAHQYTEGDVQHWWHPTQHGDRGVRTRCSDDLLWLPYTVCRYIEATGDRMLLQEKVPYLSSAPLAADEQDRYEKPARTQVQEAVLAHCCRAADLVLHRGFGSHGLPFIGVGDWNDG